VLWSLLLPDGQYAYAAIVHDTPTRHGGSFVDPVTIATIFNTVRAAGGAAGSMNERFRAAGETHVLKREAKPGDKNGHPAKRRSLKKGNL
jgi:hypothetical protein